MSDTNADHDADGETSAVRDTLAELFPFAASVLAADGAERRSLATDARAQGTNLVSLFIGILIAAVIGISVAIPVINDTIANANLSGTTATVVGLLDLFIGLMLLVGLASPLMRRV
jgi:hypothetical protein